MNEQHRTTEVPETFKSTTYPPSPPPVFDLTACWFTYGGRTVPGVKLAELLGLAKPETHSEDAKRIS